MVVASFHHLALCAAATDCYLLLYFLSLAICVTPAICKCDFTYIHMCNNVKAGRPGSSEVPRILLTRWDVSSIPANGIFLTKKLNNKNKNAQRVEND